MTEKAIKDTSKPAESRETIDGLYHSPGQHDIRIHKKKDNEHSEHVHQRKDFFSHFWFRKLKSFSLFSELSEEWVDYKAAFYFTLFLWLFSLLTLLLAWLSKSECKANRRAGGAGRRGPNINEEEPAELEDRVETLPALLSVCKLVICLVCNLKCVPLGFVVGWNEWRGSTNERKQFSHRCQSKFSEKIEGLISISTAFLFRQPRKVKNIIRIFTIILQS